MVVRETSSETPEARATHGTQQGRRVSGSLEKGLRILSCFDTAVPMLRVTDVAKLVGIDKGTTSRLLNQLAEAGFVEKGDEGYRLGPRMGALGAVRGRSIDPGAQILMAVSDLASSTLSTAQFAVYNRHLNQVTIACAAESARRVRVAADLGALIPIHATAAGRAILSALPADEVVEQLRSYPCASFTPTTLTDPAALAKVVETARERGYAVVRREYFPEQHSIGAAVRVQGLIYGALAILLVPGEVTSERDEAALGNQVSRAAQKLGALLTLPGYYDATTAADRTEMSRVGESE